MRVAPEVQKAMACECVIGWLSHSRAPRAGVGPNAKLRKIV